MKKVILMFIACAFLSVSLLSCAKKCGHCSGGTINGQQACEKDAGTDGYKEVKSECAAQGGSWTED